MEIGFSLVYVASEHREVLEEKSYIDDCKQANIASSESTRQMLEGKCGAAIDLTSLYVEQGNRAKNDAFSSILFKEVRSQALLSEE